MAKDVRIIPADGDIQFYNAAASASGKIQQVNDDLVLSNAVGDILFGDTNSDVYIGDGVSNVDIIFEQNGEIRGEAGSNVTLTLGSKDTTIYVTGSTVALQKDGGNVGISTTSPGAKLHVSQSGNGTSNSLIVEDDARKLKIGRDQIAAYDKSDSATQIYINPGGNVSMNSSGGGTVIGSTGLPSNAKLAVVGNISGSGDLFIKGNVGIGTTSPQVPLHVQGNRILLERSGSNDASIEAKTTNAGAYFKANSEGASGYYGLELHNDTTAKWFIGSYGSTSLEFVRGAKSTGTRPLVIDNSDRIGIGTTSPEAKLDVRSDAQTDVALIAGYGVQPNLIVGTDTGYTRLEIATGSYHHKFYTRTNVGASSERFTIEGGAGTARAYFLNSNVGINTSSPQGNLHVNGVSVISANDTAYNAGYFTKIRSYYSANPFVLESRAGTLMQAEDFGRTLAFHAGPDSNTAEVMRVDESGKVGIGTTSPEAKLDVSGSGNFTNGLTITGSSGQELKLINPTFNSEVKLSAGSGYLDISPSTSAYGFLVRNNVSASSYVSITTYSDSAKIRYKEVAGSAITIDSDGVGIGTTAPAEKLEVYSGNIKLNDGSRNLIIGEEGSSSYQIKSSGYLVIDATSGIQINKTTNGNISILNGSVGIGTSTPADSLHISQSNPGIRLSDSTVGREVDLRQVGNQFIIRDVANNASFINANLSNNPVTVESSGIWTFTKDTTIEGDLTVGGKVTAQEFHTEFVSASIIFKSGSTQFGDDSNDTHIFSGSLTQYTSATSYIKLRGGSGDLQVISDNNTAPVAYIKGTGTADLLNVFDNTTEVFTILDGGNVGIGTATPQADLHVIGNISASNNLYVDNYLYAQGAAFTDPVTIFDVNASENPRLSVGRGGGESLNFDVEDTIARIYHKQDETDSNVHKLNLTVDSDSTGGSEINLGFRDNDGSNESTKLIISSSGNVGIGTTTPQRLLDVNGDVRVKRNIYGADGSYIGFFADGGSAIPLKGRSLALTTNFANNAPTNGLYVQGDAGIGTTAPAEKLTVEGNISGSGKLFLGTVDFNTTSTAALVLNGSEVEQRSLGNAAFQGTGSMTVLSADSADSATTAGSATTATSASHAEYADNAGQLDGVDSTSFLRSDTSDTFTNGTLSFSAGTNFNGSQANTTDSYSIASKFLANPASEAGEWADVRIMNNLAGAHKWATITLTDCYQSDRTTAVTALNANAFDGTSANHQLYQNAAGDPMVIQIDLPFTVTWSAWVGIVFGNTAWRTKSVKIETFRNGAWQTECDLTNQPSHIVARQVANNDSNGVTKIRYTLDDLQNTTSYYIRILSLFNLNYATGAYSYGGVHYIDKYKDSIHYGHLRPATDSTYDLGSTSLYYRAMYSDKIYLNALDTNTTSTTALVLNGNEVEKRTLATGAFTTVGNSATQNTGSMTVLSADSADSATTATNADNINVDEKNDNVDYQVLFSTANGSGNQRPYIDTDNAHFLYNPSTHTLTVGTFSGNLSGNATTATNATTASYASSADYANITGTPTLGNAASQNTGSMTVLSADSATTATTATNATSASYAASVNYADIIGTPTLDDYGEWYLAGEADVTDVTSGQYVKFAGGATITGAGTEGDPYLMDITPSTASYATFAVNSTTASIASAVALSTVTSNGNFDVLFETSTPNKVGKDSGGDFAYNPSTDTLTVGTVNGVATTATSASHAEYADDAGSATNARFVDVNNVTTGTEYRVVFADAAGTSYEQMNVHDDGIEYDPETGTLRVSGDVVAYNSFSDRELKDNIQTYQDGLNAVMQLNPVTYEWKKGREGQEIGLIAQEVEKVIPQVVREQRRMNEGIYKTVDYEKLVAVLIDAVQDQQKQIDELKQKLDGITS